MVGSDSAACANRTWRGGEAARVARIDRRAGAEEGDLEAEILAILGPQPAGDVPPFGAERRVRAVIRGESAARCPAARPDRGGRRGGGRGDADRGDPAEQGPRSPHHQSSRTDCTALVAVARRPASIAVAAAAPVSAAATPISVPSGMRVVIVQLNDCGLMTWISTCDSDQPEPDPRERAGQPDDRALGREHRGELAAGERRDGAASRTRVRARSSAPTSSRRRPPARPGSPPPPADR